LKNNTKAFNDSFFVFLSFFCLGIGMVGIVISIFAFKRHKQIIYRDLFYIMLISELLLFLNFAYIYQQSLNISFPVIYLHLYNILWSVFWFFFFYPIPEYAYHLVGMNVPKRLKLFFILVGSLSFPYLLIYFFASNTLWYKLLNDIIGFLLVGVVLFLWIILFIYKERVKKNKSKAYIRNLFIYFCVFLPVSFINYLYNGSDMVKKVFGFEFPSTPIFLLIWYIINLNFLIKEFYIDEFVELEIPENIKNEYQLTDREMDVLKLVIKRQSNKVWDDFEISCYNVTNKRYIFQLRNNSYKIEKEL